MDCRHDIVITVRSKAKGEKVLEAFSNIPKEKLSYIVVEDVAQDGVFDQVG